MGFIVVSLPGPDADGKALHLKAQHAGEPARWVEDDNEATVFADEATAINHIAAMPALPADYLAPHATALSSHEGSWPNSSEAPPP